jgi:hypothetical protein
MAVIAEAEHRCLGVASWSGMMAGMPRFTLRGLFWITLFIAIFVWTIGAPWQREINDPASKFRRIIIGCVLIAGATWLWNLDRDRQR